MPRRRPPLTTREIAAYTAGGRLARYWALHPTAPEPSTAWVIARLAQEDAEVMCSLGARKWWRWFWRGWEDMPSATLVM